MKLIKFFLAALLLTVCGTLCHAQKVVVYKSDGTLVEYKASDVKQVKLKEITFKDAFYFYAGWTKPTSEAEIESLVASTAADGNGVSYKAALIGSSLNGFTYDFATEGNSVSYTSRATFYLILPVGLAIYDNLGSNVVADQFDVETASWNNNYKVYTSKEGSRHIDCLNIK